MFEKERELFNLRLDCLQQADNIFENICAIFGEPDENRVVAEQQYLEDVIYAILNRIEENGGYTYIDFECEHCDEATKR